MKKLLLFTLLISLLTLNSSCSRQTVEEDEVGVYILKPWFFGSGGVDSEPLLQGSSWVALSTGMVTLKKVPIKYAESFDDVMSDDNTPVDLQSYVILQVDAERAPILLKNYGQDWYNNNIRETFRKFIRDRVSNYAMFKLTSDRETCQLIEEEATALLQEYFDKLNTEKEFPVKIQSIIVDRAKPNGDVLEEINRTASQIQAKKTQTERISMEQEREKAERAKALADRAYMRESGMSPDQFIQFRAVEVDREKVEMIKNKDNVNVDVLLGNTMPNWDVKKRY